MNENEKWAKAAHATAAMALTARMAKLPSRKFGYQRNSTYMCARVDRLKVLTSTLPDSWEMIQIKKALVNRNAPTKRAPNGTYNVKAIIWQC